VCGSNTFGRLGHGDWGEDTAVLTRAQGALLGKRVVGVWAGDYHTAAITDAGELFTWGFGDHGRLGHGDYEEDEDTLVPTQVQGELCGKHVLGVSCGAHHTAAVAEGGELYVWGRGMACGSEADFNSPRLVAGALHGVRAVSVSAGYNHTAVLTAAGALYTFSRGVDGQPGRGDHINRAVPTLVGGALQGRVAASVAAGWMRTAVVITEWGAVYFWRNNC
jgi:alpha-tubulin suppressor-like RCC1 family protein